jgi:hypothetical protein
MVSKAQAVASGPQYVEQVIEDGEGIARRVMVHLGESPLLWLRARKLLSDRQFLAGEALRRDWEMAGPDPTLTQLSAKDRFHAALKDAGPGLADILWRVVCAGEGLSHAEKALQWPSRAGKLVLTLALERVAGFYRIG